MGSVYSFGISNFDGNGSVLTANDSANGNWTYHYDNLNRLQWAKLNGQEFDYYPDQYGNMWCTAPTGYSCTPKQGSDLHHLTFNRATNRIADDDLHQYHYDNDVAGGPGNLTADGSHGYVYDLENRITCVGVDTNGNCTTTSNYYFYDAEGQRVGKQQFNNLEDYVYDPQGHITSVYQNGSTTPFRAEVYTPQGRHVSTWNPGANNGPLFYNFADWLGTERVRTTVINGTVTVAESCQDTPYGMNLTCATFPGITDTSPMHFTGKQRDYESNLDNFGARYFGGGNNLGRFMTTDPAGSDAADLSTPQTWNMYAYAGNNPTTNVDPDGQAFCQYDDGSPSESSATTTAAWCGDEGGTWVYESGDLQTVQNSQGDTAQVPTPSTEVTVNGTTGESSSASYYLQDSDVPLTPAQRKIFTLAYQETMYDLGCTGLGFLGGDTGAALFQLGQPVAGSKPFLTKGAAVGTSALSKALRGAVRSPVAIPTPTGGPGTGAPLRMMATKDLGAAAARYAPFLGAAATAYSAYKMNKCLGGHP